VPSPLQNFYCFNENDHDCLTKASPDRHLLIERQDYAEKIDEVLNQQSSSIFLLMSLDKIVPPEEAQSGRYNFFVRQFAGDGSPKVDNTFMTSNKIQGLWVYFKMTDAREYTEHSPLSVDLFQSFCHVVQIQLSFLALLEKDLGRVEICLGGQSVMNPRRGLSYLGPRKKGNMQQSTVAEGPNEPGIGQEHPFCFHCKQTNHKFWLFVHGFVDLLVGGTTLAFIHTWLSCSQCLILAHIIGKKSCPSKIKAIEFCSSCHLDKSDDQKQFAGALVERLQLVVNQFQHLWDRSIELVEARYQEACNDLKHIQW
jgi:hypothetical protein